MEVDHSCPVAWADEHGLLAATPMDMSWCLSHRRGDLMAIGDGDAKAPALRVWQDGRLSIYYAPWDWVNTTARVMLVGITPGLHQATEALRETQRCLRAGLSNEETLRRADAVGSFSGPMRANLVSMLDGIGLAAALGLMSTARLFDSAHHMAAHVSAIDYPVFVNGTNYGGANPPLLGHPVLRSLVTACLGARVSMAGAALVVPLGHAAQGAVEALMDSGVVSRQRTLLGVPHPSGANGWRVRHYQARREMLTERVEAWAARYPAATQIEDRP